MRDYGRLASTAFGREHMCIAALVVGAGALGNEVLKNLALLGVDRVWIVDRDSVEASNLTRSILFCTPDIDRDIELRTAKAIFAARRVSEINPDVSPTAYVGEIADLGYGIIRRADVVFSCVDNEMARLELSWACWRLGALLVDGGLGLENYSSGQVTVYPRRLGPCYACRKGAARRSELMQELHGREDPCWRKDEAIERAHGVATTPLMASIIAAFQVELGIRGLAQNEAADTTLGRAYRTTLHPTPSLDASVFERSPSCPLHEPSSAIMEVRERDDARSSAWTPADVLAAAGASDGYLVLDWPLTARAVCRTCAHQWEPLIRRARFRRAVCPLCGGADLVETEVLSGIPGESAWAGRTLASLGLPRGHIYEVMPRSDPSAARIYVEISGDLDGR